MGMLKNREKSLRHVAMVAKFLMTTSQKRHLKGEFSLCQTLSILFNFIIIAKFSGIECERTVSINVRKEKFVLYTA